MVVCKNCYIIQYGAGRNGHWEEQYWNNHDPHYNNEFHVCYEIQNPVSDSKVQSIVNLCD